ncbi:MAG: PilN domain-containing protein [Candidatus Melainabacteria bacterium]|nr:PilN domain-containing protein [Candidatus Melainabacteria bacterium]
MVFKSNNPKKLNRVLGIEISENDIVASEILFAKNTINITSGFRLNIPVLQDINKTVTLFKQNLKAFNIKTKECAIGYSMQYFKLLPVTIPASIPQNEIISIVAQEANVDPENEIVTWIPLNNTRRQDLDGITRFDVLGISIKRTLVEIAKLISNNSNLKLISLSPSFLGLGSFFSSTPSNNLTATLWISQIRSELVVWSGQEPIYEHLFLTHQLSDQVFQSMTYIQAQLAGAQISKILTAGTFVKETNLSQIPYNIQPFSLPQNIIDSGRVLQGNSLSEIITSLGMGLAASNNFPYSIPNLLLASKPKTESKTQGIKDLFKDISKAQTNKVKEMKLPFTFINSLDPLFSKFILASALVILFSIFINLFIQNFLAPNVQAKESISESRINLVQNHLTKLLNFEKTNKVLNLKSEYFSGLIDERKPWSKILREIGDMAPKELWIDRLEARNDTINIFGRALNVDAVANFSINLNYTAKLLDKAQIIALKKSQEDGVDIIEFQVSTNINVQKQLALNKNKEDKPLKTDPKT